MASNKQLSFFTFLTIFGAISAALEDDIYLIRTHPYQALVLDGSKNDIITLQYFTNSSTQFWKFQTGKKVGMYYIINHATGKAIDYRPGTAGLQLVQNDKRNILRQQWRLRFDGRIVNVENRRNFDVRLAIFAPENWLILMQENGNQAQEFVVDKLKDIDVEKLKKRVANAAH